MKLLSISRCVSVAQRLKCGPRVLLHLTLMWKLLGFQYLSLFKKVIFIYFCTFCAACGILVSRPGVRSVPSASEAWHLNPWITREVPVFQYLLTLLVRLLHGFLPAIFPMSSPLSGCCSVTKLCPTLCNHMNCSMPGFLVLHYLLEFAQTHVYWVSDAIQPSHPLSPPFSSCPQSFPASGSFPVSQLFALGGWSVGASASVLPMNI